MRSTSRVVPALSAASQESDGLFDRHAITPKLFAFSSISTELLTVFIVVAWMKELDEGSGAGAGSALHRLG